MSNEFFGTLNFCKLDSLFEEKKLETMMAREDADKTTQAYDTTYNIAKKNADKNITSTKEYNSSLYYLQKKSINQNKSCI